MNTWSRIFLLIAIGAVIWACICHSNNKEAQNETKEYKEYIRYIKEDVDDGYLYVDLNGVYHYTQKCIVLHRSGANNSLYSYKHFRKSSVKDWDAFFETEQVCSRCFKIPFINQLKKDTIPVEKHNNLYHLEVDELFNEWDYELNDE